MCLLRRFTPHQEALTHSWKSVTPACHQPPGVQHLADPGGGPTPQALAQIGRLSPASWAAGEFGPTPPQSFGRPAGRARRASRHRVPRNASSAVERAYTRMSAANLDVDLLAALFERLEATID